MKLRHIVLGTTMAAAAVSTIASRALILEAPPEYIFSEAPEALDSPVSYTHLTLPTSDLV